MKSDEQIIADFKETGESSVLNELVSRHMRPIHGLAFKMTGNQSLADDIAQEVFLKVVLALPKFLGGSLFSTWLYRIAMNSIYTALKKRTRPLENVLLEVPVDVEDAAEFHPESSLLQLELRKEVEHRIQELKPEFRAAFQELSPGEAAKIEECTPQTFYWRLHEARKQLKQSLSRYLES